MKRAMMFVTLLTIGACTKNKGPEGQIRIHASTNNDSTAAQQVACADFTLQPYAVTSATTISTAGNNLLSFSSSALNSEGDAGASTDYTTGCIAGPAFSVPGPGGTTVGANWGFTVTATNFNDCNGHAYGTAADPDAGAPNVSPATVVGTYPVLCVTNRDEPLDINVKIVIDNATAASDGGGTGYIDISAGVEITDLSDTFGCKIPDFDRNGSEGHFGASYLSADGGVSDGIIGFSTGTGFPAYPLPASIVFSDGLAVDQPQVDSYFTGRFNPSVDTSIVANQSFLPHGTFDSGSPCHDNPTQYEYAAEMFPVCSTSYSSGSALTSRVYFEDAYFAQWGFEAVGETIADMSKSSTNYGITGSHIDEMALTSTSLNLAPGINVMDPTTGGQPLVNGYTHYSDTLGHGTGTMAYPEFTAGTAKTLGVWVDRGAPHQFIFLEQDSSGNQVIQTLSFPGPVNDDVWSAATPVPCMAEAQCRGMYGTGAQGCIAIKNCSNLCP